MLNQTYFPALEIRGCREPRAPLNSHAAPSKKEGRKDVLVSIHNTFRWLWEDATLILSPVHFIGCTDIFPQLLTYLSSDTTGLRSSRPAITWSDPRPSSVLETPLFPPFLPPPPFPPPVAPFSVGVLIMGMLRPGGGFESPSREANRPFTVMGVVDFVLDSLLAPCRITKDSPLVFLKLLSGSLILLQISGDGTYNTAPLRGSDKNHKFTNGSGDGTVAAMEL